MLTAHSLTGSLAVRKQETDDRAADKRFNRRA